MLKEVNGTCMLWPFLIFFTRVQLFKFLYENAKYKDRLCPLPYEEVLEDIIKTVWKEQCGNLKEMRYLGKAALVSKTWVKSCLPALHFLMGHIKGKNGSFIAIRMRIHQNFSSFKKKQREEASYAQTFYCYVHMWYIC